MKLLIFTLACFFCFELRSQNLVPNSSFEEKISWRLYPSTYGDFEGLEEWHDFISADWYYIGEFMGNNHFPDIPTFYTTIPNSGNGFIGFGPCEGAEVKLTRKLEIGETIKVSFYYLVPKNSVDTEINLYLFKNRESVSSVEDYCFEPRIDSAYHIRVPINSGGTDANVTTYTWYKYEGFFPVISDNGYEWLGFKGPNISGNSNSPRYVCVDDFKIENACHLNVECKNTKGAINPNINTLHSFTWTDPYDPTSPVVGDWFRINNLDNVSSYSLEIRTLLGQLLYSTSNSSLNGFTEPIYWDGRNEIGAEAAAASYVYAIDLTNDCETKSYTGNFTKTNSASGTPTPPPPTPPTHNNINVAPRVCCLNDYILDNETIGNGFIVYRTANNLHVGPNVTFNSGAQVYLVAGNEVIIDGNVTIGNDVDIVVIESVPCGEAFMKKDYSANESNQNLEPEYSENTASVIATPINQIVFQTPIQDTETQLAVYPNPNTGEFTLEIINPISGIYNVNITDMLGREVLKQDINTDKGNISYHINIKELPKGIFFVKISGANINEVKKVVYE